MPAGTTADTPEGSSRMGSSTLVLPDLPVKTPPVHEGQKIMTAVDAALNAATLLEVARGGSPPRNAALKDYPIHELGPIASMDPRLRLKRLEWERENEILAQKRYTNTMSDRTQVALAFIRACFANYPEYGNQIRSLCDYSSLGVPGAYYDGPRAYLLYKHHVHPSKARL